jgi:hypothetical protein
LRNGLAEEHGDLGTRYEPPFVGCCRRRAVVV